MLTSNLLMSGRPHLFEEVWFPPGDWNPKASTDAACDDGMMMGSDVSLLGRMGNLHWLIMVNNG